MPFIRTYWILEHNHTSAAAETILPDGCMELIIHFGDEYISDIAGASMLQSQPVLIGQIKQAITVQPTGYTGILAVRFQPWGFTALTGIPANSLTGMAIDLADIWGREAGILSEQVAQQPAHDKKIAIVESFLLQTLAGRRLKNKISRTVPLVNHLVQHNGNMRLTDLASQANMSMRNFNRTITEATGLSPKQLSRILRIQSFLNTYTGNKTFTESLYLCGYYDQSHFIRDFKEIANTTPGSFFKADNTMAELMWSV